MFFFIKKSYEALHISFILLVHKSKYYVVFLGCGDVVVGGCYEDATAIFRKGWWMNGGDCWK
jgi:hypothetical protein